MDLEQQLKKRVRLARLFDLYSGILTDRQKRAFELHDLSDWSLQEVSEALGCSRQGVYDLVQRARERLLELEEAVRFDERLEIQSKRVRTTLDRYAGQLPEGFFEEMQEILGETAEEAAESDV